MGKIKPMVLPQEIEVWYILPAIRKEIANILITQYNIPQKQIAYILGITEAAVSQYKKNKRAKIELEVTIKEEVKISAKKMLEDPNYMVSEITRLLELAREKKIRCQIHMQFQEIPHECKLCEYNTKKN